MPRLMLNGKIPSRDELMTDDEVLAMVNQAKEEGKTEALKGVPTKETVIQSLTPDELKVLEPVKQMITTAETEAKKTVERPAIIQSLTTDEIKELPVTQALVAEKLKEAKFMLNIVQAVSTGKVIVAGDEGVAISKSMELYKKIGGGAK